MEHWASLASQVVALLGVVGTAYFKFASDRNRIQAEEAKQELIEEADAFSWGDFLKQWNGIHQDLVTLCKDTPVDRFLILRAWNGRSSPKWTTAYYQFREGGQAPVNYIHFELDSDYVERLKQICSGFDMVFKVSEIPDSAIKHVYEAEGVTYSAWFEIGSRYKGKSRLIEYCSFATHGDEAFDKDTLIRCRGIVGRLKGLTEALS